ncbi:urease accessory protein UreD [Gordonia jinghuaiqii]|uniref:Urease accessory protein UreD n=1 Tax=Gordonia jinghuaiqii TaxID=2758710 RepID=A0A7D7RMK8_9ACTN|nr:urease accessory protein UreD [Gordonia jinghuaiqii]MCR5976759.1 urease accessory protein UreD [Gordonia jinghuaiqii]QMS99932.1 urease accessory protein UreD [Gordonia jinghuaiqii]
MRTEVEIVATLDRGVRHSATGGLAVRVTAPGVVQLIGTAATPLGGDEIAVRIRVEPGAELTVGSVAAMIALPARGRPDSAARWDVEVGDGGRLRLDPQPTVVAGGAVHTSDIVARIHPDATLALHEHIQIGRSSTMTDMAVKDRAGEWTGGLRVEVGERVVLAHRVALGARTPAGACGHRAMSSVFRYPDRRPEEVHPTDFAARLRLAGDASLTSSLGASVATTRRLADGLDLLATPNGR